MNYTKAELEAALRRAEDTETPKDVALLRSWDPLMALSVSQVAAAILAAHHRRVCGDLETAVAELRADERHVKAEALQEALDILNGEYLP